MRPGQQNRRMRGRNNNSNNNNNNNNNGNNRRGPNPLTRSYESNGPDVKIRGSAQQIAEKYTTLARDAQSSGDRVIAENYLQHAEHYNRIVAAAQAQVAIHQARENRDEMDEDSDDERGESMAGGGGREHRQSQSYAGDGSGPQPVIEGMPAEVAYDQNGGEGERPQPAQNGRDERLNGTEAAAAGEEGGSARRGRRPRRRPNGHGEEEGRINGAPSAEAATEAEQPSSESGGAMEQTE